MNLIHSRKHNVFAFVVFVWFSSIDTYAAYVDFYMTKTKYTCPTYCAIPMHHLLRTSLTSSLIFLLYIYLQRSEFWVSTAAGRYVYCLEILKEVLSSLTFRKRFPWECIYSEVLAQGFLIPSCSLYTYTKIYTAGTSGLPKRHTTQHPHSKDRPSSWSTIMI